MPTPTKTKTTKIDTLHPPRDIVDNTKARRAWLAAEVERINAMPNRSAKIVGQGSYQTVSVYEVTKVAGRLRFRGICQYCGNSQVVQGDRMVLHGYKRPGDGQTFGRCPGTNRAPLNASDMATRTWHKEATEQVGVAQREYDAAVITDKAAHDALYDGGKTREPGAQMAAPRLTTAIERNASMMQAYLAQKKTWALTYPLTAAALTAGKHLREADNALYGAKRTVEHFARLLNSKIRGTPLTEEIVA